MKKTGTTIIILGIIAAAIIFSIRSQSHTTALEQNEEVNHLELVFSHNFVSYVIGVDHPSSFNLFAILNVQTSESSFEELDISLDFANENVEIVDYEIHFGMEHQEYRLLNFIIDVNISGDEIEEVEELIVQFANGEKQSYEIGSWTLQNDKGFENTHIGPIGEYGVSYPESVLDVGLINDSKADVTMGEINDITESFLYEFESETMLAANETMHIDVPSFTFDSEEEFDFYAVTPILHYNLEDQEYRYNMPAVLFGISDDDEEKIERMIAQ